MRKRDFVALVTSWPVSVVISFVGAALAAYGVVELYIIGYLRVTRSTLAEHKNDYGMALDSLVIGVGSFIGLFIVILVVLLVIRKRLKKSDQAITP